MPVQAGEHRPWGHQLARLVPAVGMAQAGGVSLTLAVQDRVQPADREVTTSTSIPGAPHTLQPSAFSHSEVLLRQKNPSQVSYSTTSSSSST